ncbi:CapA family protein [Bacillus seohaeanensis]|uniref:CapA family protein n=1 Tax=Bacillus seohaeanensis TaxID=284580 RepID=A0ABW5RV58_9BACI
MKKKSLYVGIITSTIFILSIVVLLSIQYSEWNATEQSPDPKTMETHATREINTLSKNTKTRATIGAIGDILLHHTVYNDAKTNGTYDFSAMFSPIKSMLETPNFLIANQESMPGGTQLGLSSYPLFNSPHEIVKTLQNVGVDAVTNANNHSLDQGEEGILSSIAYYEKINMPYTGAFKNKQDQQTIRTFNVNGISFALLSYTYGTNGIPVPTGKEHLVNLLDEQKISTDIKEARKQGVDLVVLSLHWGNEYQRFPTDEQVRLAKSLTNSGADIIFGHHPHVLQPMETYKTKDGREAVVIYSLGNFLSGQKDDYKDIGGMVTVEIEKSISSDGVKISYPSVQFNPTFVAEANYQNYRIYPLADAHQKGLIANSEEELVSHMSDGIHKE